MIFRPYQPDQDSPKISQFLTQTYPPNDRNPNWLRARWEYMVCSMPGEAVDAMIGFGVWEDGDEIVGVVNFEAGLGEAFFHLHPVYTHLKADLLHHAETTLYRTENGNKQLTLFINDFDPELEVLAAANGYVKLVDAPQVTARLDLTTASLRYTLAPGFTITDRAENNDLKRINRVLWRGFNHPGPPPQKYEAGRADVERAPLYRPELVVMVAAPDGNFVSYCGIWYEAETGVAYVEPVATDPDYRRRGLGKAAVLEGVSRAKDLGANRAIVISGQEFYRAIGFRALFSYYPWQKRW